MIEVRDLRKSFGSITAVDGVSFTVSKGEVVGFLGPNGAGKTTVMRLITGYFAPDAGEVTIDGIPVLERTTEAQAHIGYLPESNPLYRDMLVSDFLALSADLKRIARSERGAALDFAVGAVGIGDVYFRPIGQLSKGFKQRVGIAAALLHKPRILIMDEPTEGLDPIQRGEIRALIRDLAKDHTIIMSTHVMQEAQAVASRLIVINRGRVVADGSAAELTVAAGHGRVIVLEVQGSGVAKALKGLAGVEHVECEDAADERVVAHLVPTEGREIRPALSKLAREREWVIWRLQEQEHSLEEVFHELTSQQAGGHGTARSRDWVADEPAGVGLGARGNGAGGDA